MIAKYITDKEYRCKCCNGLPVDFYTKDNLGEISPPYLLLFKFFKDIREAWGKAIKISSGYRCLEHNAAEGGKACSVHLFGLALDLDLPSALRTEMLEIQIKSIAPDLRLGVYTKPRIVVEGGRRVEKPQSFIHIDVGYLIFPRVDPRWRKGARWHG